MRYSHMDLSELKYVTEHLLTDNELFSHFAFLQINMLPFLSFTEMGMGI